MTGLCESAYQVIADAAWEEHRRKTEPRRQTWGLDVFTKWTTAANVSRRLRLRKNAGWVRLHKAMAEGLVERRRASRKSTLLEYRWKGPP